MQPYPSVAHIYGQVMRDHGLIADLSEIKSAFLSIYQKRQRAPRQNISENSEWEWWRDTVKEILDLLNLQANDFDALYQEMWGTFSEARCWRIADHALSAIQTMKRLGMKTAILSNWDKRLRCILTEMNITELFDKIFISSEIGVEKPNAKIFRYVEKQFDLPSHCFLHIGDSRIHDFEGAKKVGWNVLLLVDKGSFEKDLLSNEINGFRELEDMANNITR